MAEVCPSQAQAKRLSRSAVSAHLLSIRLEQHGLPFHAAAYVHLELMKCCRFHELQIGRSTTSSDSEKLFVVGCAIASSIQLRRAFARWTERARARQSRKTADLGKIVAYSQIHTT